MALMAARAPRSVFCAFLALAVWIAPGATGADDDDDKKKDAKDSPPLSIDEQYVRDNLAKYLQPSKIEWLPDGRVKLLFVLALKGEEHRHVFVPEIAVDINRPFRWSVDREEVYFDVYKSDPEKGIDDDKKSTSGTTSVYDYGGVRISDRGMALLDCWFQDDVEATMTYHQGTSFAKSNIAALVFCNKRGDAIGSNFGSQAAYYRRGSPTSKRLGEPEPVNIWGFVKTGLEVRGGKFAAYKGKRKRQELDYPSRTFSTGRVGFVWGGRTAGLISRLEITGRIDAKLMAKQLQKARR